MHYHIILTERCNLQCKYCYEKSLQEFDNGLEEKFQFDFSEPCVSQVDIQKLKSFILKDPNATIIFYGGEPLLQIPKIKQIIDAFAPQDSNEMLKSGEPLKTKNQEPRTKNTARAVPFRMQTNAQLLHLLPSKYINKITKILISIDGNQEITDHYRGKGTYKKIIDNIKLIKQNGYSGELVARMTVAQDNPNIFKNVVDIINTGLFDSVHWQLDVGFYKTDFEKNKIEKFFQEYNASITKLINWWTSQIQNGKIHKLYPFIAITQDLIQSPTSNLQPPKLRCGAGHSGYAITTSGKLVACPIMNNIENFKAGTLEDSPQDLKKFDIQECKNCSHLNLCGGRCLYWRKTCLWPKEGDEMICNSIKYYIDEIKKQIPKIKRAIKKNKISKKDFEYERYFGPEIIP